MFRAAVLLAAVVAVAVAELPSDWNQEMRDYILDMHNEFRKNEGACRMNKLVYDMDLEEQAKGWAEKCEFKHEMIDGRGENLAWDTSHDPEKELIKSSYQRWFDEKNLYSYGNQDACQRSCHYTQLVWHTTQKVGCWSTRCPDLKFAYTDAYYLVCFYTPIGNWVGEKPYEKTCDTPCREGQTEEDGLCVGEAKGGDGHGSGCADDNENCELWANHDQCEANPGWMLKHCKISCKVCTPEE